MHRITETPLYQLMPTFDSDFTTTPYCRMAQYLAGENRVSATKTWSYEDARCLEVPKACSHNF